MNSITARRQALDGDRSAGQCLGRLAHAFGGGADLALRAARRDDHIISNIGFSVQADDHDVLGLDIFEFLDNGAAHILGGGPIL